MLSYLFRGDTRGGRYTPHLAGRQPMVSFMTLAETERWARRRNWGAVRRQQFAVFLQPYTVVHSSPEICRWWAHVVEAGRTSGRNIDPADAWIAATALAFGCPLITHNPGHFSSVPGLTLITETS